MMNAHEDASDISILRQALSEKDRELDLLRSCLHCVREDLNVKNEQFDFLYASLKASSEFSAAERAAAEAAAAAESKANIQALRARVNFLERVVSDQARRLGEKSSHSRADRDKWVNKSAGKQGWASLTAALGADSRAAVHHAIDKAGVSNCERDRHSSSSQVNGAAGKIAGSAAATSRKEFGLEVAFTNAAAASDSTRKYTESKRSAVSLLMLDDELLRLCMTFGRASDLSTLATVSGPALCAIARGEELWCQLYCYTFGSPSEVDTNTANNAGKNYKPMVSGLHRRGGQVSSSNGSAKRYPGSNGVDHSPGEWFRKFAVRATAERRWKRGAAQSIVLRGHTASGGFDSAATVTCLATRFERRFVVSGGDDGSLAFWHLARRPTQTHAFTFQGAKTHGSSKGNDTKNGRGNVRSGGYRDDGTLRTSDGASDVERHEIDDSGGGEGGNEVDENGDEEEVMLRPPPALALAQLATGESSSRSSRSTSNTNSSVFNGSLGSVMGALRVSGSSLSSGSHGAGSASGGSGGSEGIGLGTTSGGLAGNSSSKSMGNHSSVKSHAIDDGGKGHYLEFEKMRAFHGHGGPVWCLALDEHRNRLVSGSYDRTVKVWDLQNGSCLRTLRGHAGWVSCVGIVGGDHPHAANSSIVSGSWDATIKVWDNINDGPPAQDPLRTTLHCGVGNALYCLDSMPTNHPSLSNGGHDEAAISSSNFVAVGCRQRHVQVWDLSVETQVLRCEGHQKEVGALHWASPALMVTGSGDSTVKAWDPRANNSSGSACTATLRGHSGAVMCVSADANRHRVVSGGVDKSVTTWDLRKPDQPLLVHAYNQVHQGAVFAVQIDGDRVVSGGADGRIGILNFSY